MRIHSNFILKYHFNWFVIKFTVSFFEKQAAITFSFFKVEIINIIRQLDTLITHLNVSILLALKLVNIFDTWAEMIVVRWLIGRLNWFKKRWFVLVIRSCDWNSWLVFSLVIFKEFRWISFAVFFVANEKLTEHLHVKIICDIFIYLRLEAALFDWITQILFERLSVFFIINAQTLELQILIFIWFQILNLIFSVSIQYF